MELKKTKNLKIKPITLISIAISIIPLYFAINITYNLESNITDDNIVPFITDFLYYVLDVILFAPSLIVISTIKNNPYVFHWISITLGITIMVIADLGFTYSAQISEELIVKTSWTWNIFYAISYLFFVAAIFWYVKIKRILEDKKINSIITSSQTLLKKFSKFDVVENMIEKATVSDCFYEKTQVFNTLQDILWKAKEYVSIMITKRSFLHNSYIIDFFKHVTEEQNINNYLNIRLLIPRSKSKEMNNSMWSNDVKHIKFQLFDREMSFNEMIVVLDHEYVFIISASTFIEDIKEKKIIAEFTNDKSKVLIYSNIFERIW